MAGNFEAVHTTLIGSTAIEIPAGDGGPQAPKLVIKLREPEAESEEDKGGAVPEIHPPPELANVEGEEAFRSDPLTLAELFRKPTSTRYDRGFGRRQLSKGRDEDLAHIDRECEELDIGLLDTLQVERHGRLSGCAADLPR